MLDGIQARLGATTNAGGSHSRRVDPTQDANNAGAVGLQSQSGGSLLQTTPDVGSSGLSLLA